MADERRPTAGPHAAEIREEATFAPDDDGLPSFGAHHGQTHTRRPTRAGAGQGQKTRKATKNIISGRAP